MHQSSRLLSPGMNKSRFSDARNWHPTQNSDTLQLRPYCRVANDMLQRSLVVFLSMIASPVLAADGKTGFLDRTHTNSDGTTSKYVLFVPDSFDPAGTESLPVILFLHGAGESGNDGKKQARVGLGPAVRKFQKDFPFLVIFPVNSGCRR